MAGFNILEWLKQTIRDIEQVVENTRRVNHLEGKIKKIMADLNDVATALTELETAESAAQTDLQAALAKLETAANTGPDTSSLITRINNVTTSLNTADATAKAIVAGQMPSEVVASS